MLNDKNLKSVADAAAKIMAEALKGDQHKIDKNKNNKIDAHDFKLLRKEGWDDMVKTAQDSVKSGPKPSGGAGVKQGTRYGGGKQKDEKPVKEEASQAEFTAELKKAQAKAAGTAKQADVAKPAVQAVQNEETHTKIEVIDLSDVNEVKMSTIELQQERALTPSEEKTKEHNVKSMKKNLQGFKDRYGKDAKSVMYATATKQAKGE